MTYTGIDPRGIDFPSTGLRMQGHYIELDGPSSEREVLEVLEHLLSPRRLTRSTHCPPLLTLQDGRTIVFVDAEPGPGGPVLLAIGNLDDDEHTGDETARSVHQMLEAATPWRIHRSRDAQVSTRPNAVSHK